MHEPVNIMVKGLSVPFEAQTGPQPFPTEQATHPFAFYGASLESDHDSLVHEKFSLPQWSHNICLESR